MHTSMKPVDMQEKKQRKKMRKCWLTDSETETERETGKEREREEGQLYVGVNVKHYRCNNLSSLKCSLS